MFSEQGVFASRLASFDSAPDAGDQAGEGDWFYHVLECAHLHAAHCGFDLVGGCDDRYGGVGSVIDGHSEYFFTGDVWHGEVQHDHFQFGTLDDCLDLSAVGHGQREEFKEKIERQNFTIQHDKQLANSDTKYIGTHKGKGIGNVIDQEDLKRSHMPFDPHGKPD